MYGYIMQRTQIYLTPREAAALDAAARRTGQTRSHLIREAIEAVYLGEADLSAQLAALDRSAGAWADRDEDGEAYVDRVRPGALAKRLASPDPGAD
jgi:predicted DNA-binding protein